MKKSLIALAVAATVATPMAASAAMLQAADADQSGINLYGSLRPQWVSQGDNSMGDGASRWGIRGQHDLGNGQNAFYRMEMKVNTSNANFSSEGRLAYAGLGGGWGSASFGQQWTPYYSTIGSPSDIFASNGLDNYNDTGGPFRASNMITYALPGEMIIGGAISAVVAGDEFDENGVVSNDDEVDVTSLGLTAMAGPVKLGLGVHDTSATNRTRVGFSASGDLGPVFAAFMIEDTDPNEGDGGSTPWAITGQMAGFALQYGDRDFDVDSAFWTLGYQYRMSSNTRIQFSYEADDADDDDKFVARYRVDF